MSLSSPRSGAGQVPRHHEAYPSLAIKAVVMRWRRGERYCEWSNRHQLIGQMDLVHYDDHELEILYSCGADTYRSQRTSVFTVLQRLQRSRRIEPRVECEGCGGLVDRLMFRAGLWRCSGCHQLVPRHGLLTKAERLIVRRDRLIPQVHGKRPIRSWEAHMRNRDRLVRTIAALDAGGHMFLPPPLNNEAVAAWFSDEADRQEREIDDMTPAYIDLPCPTKSREAAQGRQPPEPWLGSRK